jgi:hypothetical protein
MASGGLTLAEAKPAIINYIYPNVDGSLVKPKLGEYLSLGDVITALLINDHALFNVEFELTLKCGTHGCSKLDSVSIKNTSTPILYLTYCRETTIARSNIQAMLANYKPPSTGSKCSACRNHRFQTRTNTRTSLLLYVVVSGAINR